MKQTEGGDKGGFPVCNALGPSCGEDEDGDSPEPSVIGISTFGRCALGATMGTGLVMVTVCDFPNKSPSASSSPNSAARVVLVKHTYINMHGIYDIIKVIQLLEVKINVLTRH